MSLPPGVTTESFKFSDLKEIPARVLTQWSPGVQESARGNSQVMVMVFQSH